MKTNDHCQQTRGIYGIYQWERCNGERIFYTSNTMGTLTRLYPYTVTTNTTATIFFYNPMTQHVWLAKEDTQEPYYLQETYLTPQSLQFQISNHLIVPGHPIYNPMAVVLDQ